MIKPAMNDNKIKVAAWTVFGLSCLILVTILVAAVVVCKKRSTCHLVTTSTPTAASTNGVRSHLLRSRQNLRLNYENEPIDLVVSWVDGTDLALRRLKLHHQNRTAEPPHPGAVAECRTVGHDEMKYLMRSICMYAPWIRKVYVLVSHRQRPAWLAGDSDKLQVVNDADIFPDSGHLPTFNSHALEAHLHRIPGLSPHYIYACDDMMFGNATSPSDFFTSDGKVAVQLSHRNKKPMSFGSAKHSMHQAAWRNNYRQLRKRGCGSAVPQYLPTHQMVMTSLEMARRADKKFSGPLKATSASRFRHKDNVHPVGLQLYNGICEGLAKVADARPTMHYVGWGECPQSNWQKLQLVALQQPQLLCVNNVRGADVKKWIEFAEEYFPGKCVFEV